MESCVRERRELPGESRLGPQRPWQLPGEQPPPDLGAMEGDAALEHPAALPSEQGQPRPGMLRLPGLEIAHPIDPMARAATGAPILVSTLLSFSPGEERPRPGQCISVSVACVWQSTRSPAQRLGKRPMLSVRATSSCGACSSCGMSSRWSLAAHLEA